MTDRTLIYMVTAGNAGLAWYWSSHACNCATADNPILRKLFKLFWMFIGFA